MSNNLSNKMQQQITQHTQQMFITLFLLVQRTYAVCSQKIKKAFGIKNAHAHAHHHHSHIWRTWNKINSFAEFRTFCFGYYIVFQLCKMVFYPSPNTFSVFNGELYLNESLYEKCFVREMEIFQNSQTEACKDIPTPTIGTRQPYLHQELYTDPMYISNVITPLAIASPINYRFISVEYMYSGDIDTPSQIITLHFPAELYFDGSIILTPIFVLWCLYNQNKRFIFDGNYTLRIIDQNIKIIHITNKHYIQLHQNNYVRLFV